MAVKPGESTGIAFNLLGTAPEGTYKQIGPFLTTTICEPAGTTLQEITDKTLARRLSAWRDHQGMTWGLGSGGRSEWHEALEALKRFIKARSNDQKKMAIGQALAYLGDLAGGAGPVTNDAVTGLVRWNLDGDYSFGLLNELRYRVADALRQNGNADLARRLHDSPLPPLHRSPVKVAAEADQAEAHGYLLTAQHLRSLPHTPTWAEMGVKRDLVFRIALRFSEGDVEKAKQLGELAFS